VARFEGREVEVVAHAERSGATGEADSHHDETQSDTTWLKDRNG
jgi:hypothetical protein